MPTPRFLTVKEFLEYIEEATGKPMSRSAAYRAIQTCKLPTLRLGGKLLVDTEQLRTEAALAGVNMPTPKEKN